MTSMFTNPNVFAGCVGLGTLLSLGLVVSSAGRERTCASSLARRCCACWTACAVLWRTSSPATAGSCWSSPA